MFFRKALGLLDTAKVIVTDRLHASILALLMHKPHVILDNMYKKLTRTRQVAFQVSKSCQDKAVLRYEETRSMEEAVTLAAKLMRTHFPLDYL